jgi:hypothetical protein
MCRINGYVWKMKRGLLLVVVVLFGLLLFHNSSFGQKINFAKFNFERAYSTENLSRLPDTINLFLSDDGKEIESAKIYYVLDKIKPNLFEIKQIEKLDGAMGYSNDTNKLNIYKIASNKVSLSYTVWSKAYEIHSFKNGKRIYYQLVIDRNYLK